MIQITRLEHIFQKDAWSCYWKSQGRKGRFRIGAFAAIELMKNSYKKERRGNKDIYVFDPVSVNLVCE